MWSFKELEGGGLVKAADGSNGHQLVPPESNGCELTWGLCIVLPAATCFRRCFLLLLLCCCCCSMVSSAFAFALCVCVYVYFSWICEQSNQAPAFLSVAIVISFFDDQVDA